MVMRRRLEISGPALAFITTTVNGHKPVFSLPEIADVIVTQISESITYFDCSVVGYVIMPEHIHLLLGMKRIELLSKFIQSLKSLSSRKIKSRIPPQFKESFSAEKGYKFWNTRFDDVIINSEKQFKIKLNYIHNNPVKAGLVDRAIDWKYSSAKDWLTEDSGPIPIDKNFHWMLE